MVGEGEKSLLSGEFGSELRLGREKEKMKCCEDDRRDKSKN